MTRSTRPARVDGQLAAAFGFLAERPGSQLDLVAEAGVETLTPDTIRTGPEVEEDDTLDAAPCEWCGQTFGCLDSCGCPGCENDRALDEDADAWADRG